MAFFFATSHGKGPCDGIGGTDKRLAAKASLQRPYPEQIMTPRQLFQLLKTTSVALAFLIAPLRIGKEDKFLKRDSLRQEQ